MKSLTPVIHNKRVFSVDNYKHFFNNANGLRVTEYGVTAGYTLTEEDVDFGDDVIKIYYLLGRFFGYYTDGNLYEINNGERTLIFGIGNIAPCAKEIIHGGTKKILFVGEKACIVDEVAETISWEPSNVVCEHKGRIFSAFGRVITISTPFDFSTKTTGITIAGNIRIEQKAGDVMGFLSDNEKLYVLCRSAVYLLLTDNDFINFKLKRLYYFSPSITERTVSEYSNELICVRDKTIYTFSDGKFSKVSDFLQNLSFSVMGDATVGEGVYYVPVTIDSENKITVYALNFTDKSEGGFLLSGEILEKGYAVQSGKLYKITDKNQNSNVKSITSKQTSFGMAYDKTLHALLVETGSDCTLTIKGAFGSKKFTLKKGCNQVKTNLTSAYFSVNFSLIEKDFYLKNLQFIYSIRGNRYAVY